MAKAQRSYEELQAEIARLSQEANELREREQKEVVARIKVAIATYGLTASDLGLGRAGKSGPASTGKAKPQVKAKTVKFRDGQGNTWGGLGKRPDWIKKALAAGKQLQDFAA